MATYKRDFILSGGIGVSANDIYLSSATNSTTINTGSFITPGGVGIGQSVSLGGRLQLFNNSNYTAFISSASGNTVYTLPATSPATGSSVLSSTSGGTLSWVPLVASGGDTYLVNVNAATGNTVLFIAGINDDIGSGLAVSSNTNLTYDTNTSKLNSPFYTGTWAGSTITTLYGGTGLSAYTKGDLLVGLGDTLYKLPVGTQGQLLQAFSSSTSGLAWTSIMPPTYGAFYSTSTQQVAGAGVSTRLTLNSVYEAYNTEIYGGSGTSSRIRILTSGTYNVQFSAQIGLASGSSAAVGDIWFRINGIDVPKSNTTMNIAGNNQQTVLSLNFVSYFAANDYFELVMSSSDNRYLIEALSGLTNPPRPDIPSLIVTVVPVTQVVGSSAGLGVSGLVSLNGLNNYIQYFEVGKSGTDFNISSSSQIHTFNIPIAGTGATGLITSQAQTIGGSKTFASDTIISSTTNSTSSATGALTVTGGVGIGGSLYVASATAISGVTIDNGVITGNLIGNVTGFASTSRNVNLEATSNASPHYLVFSPNASGSGVALSTGSSITVNPNSNVLSIGTGTFAANGVSVGSASNTINTASGNLNIDSFGGQTNLNDNVVISGNLTVQGTTITVDSTVSTFVDPVIVIGSGVGGTHSTLDSNQDRGLEFRWSNSGTAITGFFGFSDLDGKFRFIPQVSSIISSVYTGTAGTAVFTTVEANLSGNSTGTASTYTNFYGTLNGNVIGNVTGNLTGTATTATNVYLAVGANASSHSVIFSPSASGSGVALSTDTTFTYNPNTDTLTVSNITGTATTSTYAHQAGYAITSGTASIATTATYAHQAGYAITSGSASIATTATYAHQAGYAITSGSSISSGSAITANNIAIQNGLNNSTHSIIFAPAISGSGIALSSNQTITFNPSTSIFSVSGIAVTANTNSTLTSTGAAIITGGVGIGQSLSIAGRLQLFNGSSYSAFVYTGSGNTVYTLPATSPAIGNSVLQSTSGGILSWVPMVASSSSGTTAQNIFINAAGTADIFHQLLFTPAQQSAGSAVSSDVLLTFNASSDRLFVSGISVTSGAASTSPFTGALQVTGGLGVSGQATFARASLGFTGVSVTPVMSFIGATTAPIISLSVLNDNSLSFEGSSGQLFAIDNNLSSGEIFSVSDISGLPIIAASAGQTVTINEFGGVTKIGDGSVNASSTSNAVLTVLGGLGVTGNAFIGGTTSINSNATSTSTGTGALVVSGGVGIGGSVFTSSSNSSSISGVVLSNSVIRTGAWAATAITSFYGGTGHSVFTTGDLLVGAGSTLAKLPTTSNTGWVLTSNGAGSIPSWQAVPPSAASSVAVSTSTVDQSFFVTFVNVSSGSGLGLTTTTSFVVNPSTGLVTASGLALTSLANSSSTTTGTLRVSGGLGLTGNAFIGGTINASSTSQSNISNVYFTNGNVTGTSVTATTFQGNLIGTATTGTNIHLASTNNVAGPFYLAMSASSSGSGVALSSDTSLQYNSATDVLTVPCISGTAITATTFSGSLFGNVTGTATSATNVHLASTGNIAGPFYITLSSNASGSGVALSSDTSLQYNSATDVLTVPYISGTAITASTSFSGQLIGNVTGFATTSRNISVSSALSAADHFIVLSPNATGSGIALSSGSNLVYNPSSNILSIGSGAFAANGISIGISSNTITTASGNLNLDSVSGQTNINDNVIISGNLTVQGTTITVDSTISTFVDPVIVLGSGVGGTHSTLDNNQDRGIEFRWSNSGLATTGFFGFSDTDGKFRFIPNASYSSPNIYTGTAGTAVFGTVEATLSGNSAGTASTYTNFYGNIIGTATTATNINLASTGNVTGPFYLTLSGSSTGSGVALSTDTALSYNSSTDVLTVSNISGSAITASTSFSGQLFGNVTGTATTSTNVHIASTGNIAGPFYLAMSSVASGSGLALSSDSSLSYNSAIDVLTVSNISGSAITASTSFAGQLIGNVTGDVTGFATTARNVSVSNSTANSPHTIYFGPSATGSGVALSSNRTLSFNPSSFILSTSGLAVTSAAVSTSTTSGALIVTGGIGVGGTIYIGGDAFISSATASTWAANGALRVQGGLGVSGQLSFNQAALGYTGASNPSIAFIGGTSGTPITMTVLSDNSLIFEGTSGKLFGINNNLSSGWIFNVGDISGLPLIRANADGTIAMTEFAGNVGIGMSNPAYKLHVSGSVGFTSSVGSSTVTTGALIVSGGVGIGNSVSVGGRLQLFNGFNFTAFVSSATGNTVYTLPATSPATGSSVLSSTSGGVLSWVPMTSGSSSGTVNAGTANFAAYYATSTSAVSENANLQFTGTGLSVGGNIESTSTRSGSLYVSGGLGITGNAFIGGTATLQSSASSVSSSTGALVVSGGVGIGGNLYVGSGSSVSGDLYASNLISVFSSGDEGGEIKLAKPSTNTTINTNVTIDVYQNKLRIFEAGGSNRGAYLDISQASTGVNSNLLPKTNYVLSFGAGFSPTANSADSVSLNIPYQPDGTAKYYYIKRIEYRNETLSGGTGLSFYLQRHTSGNASWATTNTITAGSGASFEVGASTYASSFTTISSSSGIAGSVISGDYVRLFFTTVGSAANVSISMIIEEQ